MAPNLAKLGFEVTWHRSAEVKALGVVPQACEGIFILSDMVNHPLSNAAAKYAKDKGLPLAYITRKFRHAERALIRQGLTVPIPTPAPPPKEAPVPTKSVYTPKPKNDLPEAILACIRENPYYVLVAQEGQVIRGLTAAYGDQYPVAAYKAGIIGAIRRHTEAMRDPTVRAAQIRVWMLDKFRAAGKISDPPAVQKECRDLFGCGYAPTLLKSVREELGYGVINRYQLSAAEKRARDQANKPAPIDASGLLAAVTPPTFITQRPRASFPAQKLAPRPAPADNVADALFDEDDQLTPLEATLQRYNMNCSPAPLMTFLDLDVLCRVGVIRATRPAPNADWVVPDSEIDWLLARTTGAGSTPVPAAAPAQNSEDIAVAVAAQMERLFRQDLQQMLREGVAALAPLPPVLGETDGIHVTGQDSPTLTDLARAGLQITISRAPAAK